MGRAMIDGKKRTETPKEKTMLPFKPFKKIILQ
jgi:hypothetical protein